MIYGITGLAGSGKDTVAEMLKDILEQNGTNTKRYSLADPLKRGCAELFGIPLDDFYDRDKKEEVHPLWGKSPRELLIMVGTDHLRDHFDPDIWLKRATITVDQNKQEGVVTIIPDVRFDNEAEFVMNEGGIMIQVMRDEELRDAPTIAHKSEAGVNMTSAFVIDNNGTITDLFNKVSILANIPDYVLIESTKLDKNML